MSPASGRTERFIYNASTSLLLQIVTVIAGFVIPRVMLVSFGSEINGLVSSITQFIAYFNLVEAGLAHAAVYGLYKPLAQKDEKAISAVLSAARKFYILSGYIFLTLTLGLALLYPSFVKTSRLHSVEVGVLVLLLGVSGALEFFTMAKYRVLLTADQKTYIISFASILAIVLNTIIIAALARQGASIVTVRMIALLSVFARSGVLLLYVRRHYPYIDYSVPPNTQSLTKRWDALVLQILGAVHTGVPIILATIFTSLSTVSVYSVFNLVFQALGSLFGIFRVGMAASFGDVIVRGELEVLQKAHQEYETFFYALLTWAFGCASALTMPFILVYTRGVYDVDYNQPLIGFLFVLNGFFYYLKSPQGMLVISAGLFKETRWQTTTQGAIAVSLGLILANTWGLAGILAGSICSNLYRVVDLLFYIPRNVTKLRVRLTFAKMLRATIGVFLIGGPFWVFPVQCVSYTDWFFWACIVGIYAFFVTGTLNYLFDREILLGTIQRFKAIIRRWNA